MTQAVDITHNQAATVLKPPLKGILVSLATKTKVTVLSMTILLFPLNLAEKGSAQLW